MVSEAAVMSKPLSDEMRSLTSRHRRQVIVSGSMTSSLPWKRCASSSAASRLVADVTAWMSPVKWRLRSSIGTTCDRPPPAPPPLIPKTGPIEGSRRHTTALRPASANASVRPIAVVVFPSPAGSA